MKTQISSISKSFKTRVWVTRFLIVGIFSCVVGYMSLMVSITSFIRERQEMRDTIRKTQIAISDLEVRYFEFAQSIDKNAIAELGFVNNTVPIFAYTNPENATVAFLR